MRPEEKRAILERAFKLLEITPHPDKEISLGYGKETDKDFEEGIVERDMREYLKESRDVSVEQAGNILLTLLKYAVLTKDNRMILTITGHLYTLRCLIRIIKGEK